MVSDSLKTPWRENTSATAGIKTELQAVRAFTVRMLKAGGVSIMIKS